ncbi:hypothetical protein GCM10011506_25420 [Marivirga lumbricoides]|uniref:PKD domain-containing protein n=1 Tax=Marivirga lumbricoides TaxID=1046115 RepID=A0ABQ1MKJ2_9BACT|nr:hypothetical protein GCM10011506_25420 [Marivirga lumbricoides]
MSKNLLAQQPILSLTSESTNASVRKDILIESSNVRIDGLDGVDLTVAANLKSIITFKLGDVNGATITDYTASLSADKKKITITPDNILNFNQAYYIQLDSLEKANPGVGDTLGITNYTFTTGSAVSVNNALTSNICIGDTEGTVLDTIKIFENIADNFINTTASGNTQSITLELPERFSFVANVGSVKLSESTDIETGASVSFPTGNNKRRIQIDYKLCTPGNGANPPLCNARTANIDTIYLIGLKVVAARNAPLNVSRYIRRLATLDAGLNDAEAPGFDENDQVATLRATAGQTLRFSAGGEVVNTSNTLRFCPEKSLRIGTLNSDETALNSTDVIKYFINNTEVNTANAMIDGKDIVLNQSDIRAFLNVADGTAFPAVTLRAEMSRAGECIAFSENLSIGLEPISTPVFSFNNLTIGNNNTVSPVDEGISLSINPTGGILTVYRIIAGDTTNIYVTDNYGGSTGNEYVLNTGLLADSSETVTISIGYTAISKPAGCYEDDAPPRTFFISPIPRIRQDLGIEPSFCASDEAEYKIIFSPDNLTDSTIIENFSITGEGISGNLSANYNPYLGNDSTGYSFSTIDAKADLTGQLGTAEIVIEYTSTVNKTIYEQDCRVETYYEDVEICETQEVCADEQVCRFVRECRIETICDDPEPCLNGPCPIDPCYNDPFCNSLLRIVPCRQQEVCSNVRRCQIEEVCHDKTVCRIERVLKTRTVCETIAVGIENITDTIKKVYPVQFLPVPDLEFVDVNRTPLKSVYCAGSAPVRLLGLPGGNTFENKRFFLRNNDTGREEEISSFSFTPGDSIVPVNENGYTLIFDYGGDQTNCANIETFNFRVIDLPEEVQLASNLPKVLPTGTVDSVTVLRATCLGEAIDSISFNNQRDSTVQFIWRDERGFQLSVGNSFLPDLDNTEVGLVEYTVEKRSIEGGCSGPLTRFALQISSLPGADFNFLTNCGSNVVLTPDATDNGNVRENDSIQSYYWSFNDDAFVSSNSTIEHTFPAPGVYDVDMVVQTSIGCTDTITKKVTVFDEADYAIDNGKFSYAEDFTSGSNGWISTTDNNNASPQARNSSWGIRELEGLTGWHAFNEQTGSYNDNEYSWVQSPYFNLSNWNSPKLQMDILFDTPELEGAVLQYMIKDCDNTEGSDIWIPVGRANGGLAWYNNGSISSGPGGSITGWSGISKNNNVGSNTSDSWQTVAYDLAGVRAVAGNNLVQFRIAFASLNLGVNRESGRKGFAFTNFIISEKERISLVENFTHINSQDGLRENVSDFSKAREDVVYIEYHTGRPAGDPLYFGYHFAENTSNDGATRAFVYGLDGPGYTVVNGRFQSFDPFTVGWGERQYTQETLLAPAFDLSLDYTYQEGEPLKVKAIAIRNENIVPLIDTAQQPQLMSLKVAVVEKEVTEYTQDTLRNVFVKYLGQHPGAFEEKTWKAGSSDSLILEEEWQIPVDAESGRFGLVAWIELARDSPEKGPKGLPFNNVFQAAEMSINTELVAVEVLSNRKTLAGNWVVYPNPAADFLQVQRQENIQSAIEWQVVNALGSIVKKGKYIGGNSGFEVNLAGLNAGIYMLQLNSREGQLQKKFVKK